MKRVPVSYIILGLALCAVSFWFFAANRIFGGIVGTNIVVVIFLVIVIAQRIGKKTGGENEQKVVPRPIDDTASARTAVITGLSIVFLLFTTIAGLQKRGVNITTLVPAIILLSWIPYLMLRRQRPQSPVAETQGVASPLWRVLAEFISLTIWFFAISSGAGIFRSPAELGAGLGYLFVILLLWPIIFVGIMVVHSVVAKKLFRPQMQNNKLLTNLVTSGTMAFATFIILFLVRST